MAHPLSPILPPAPHSEAQGGDNCSVMGDMDSHPSARSGRPGSGRDLHRTQVHQEETDVRAQGGPAQGWWPCLAPAAVSPLCCLALLLGPSRLPRHLSILFAPLWNFLPIKEQVLKCRVTSVVCSPPRRGWAAGLPLWKAPPWQSTPPRVGR